MGLLPRQPSRSISGPLFLAWLVVVVYASLFPFGGWRWPPGANAWVMLQLPWPRWFDSFDMIANLAGYLPLGLFGGLATSRPRTSWVAMLKVLAGVALLSYVMETTQQLLPQRVPSLLDWVLNALGGVLGLALAWIARASGLANYGGLARRRWLRGGAAAAPMLLVLWPVGLLFPAPLPLGLGQIAWRLRELALDVLVDVPGVQGLVVWLEEPGPSIDITPVFTALVAALGLLSPCLVAFAATNPGGRRLVWALGVTLIAVLATTLSAALSFGPSHALAWSTAGSLGGLTVAALCAALLMAVSPRLAAALGLMSLTGLVAMVSLVPPDPYFALNLQGWEQGRFIRFHGVAQWVGWLWPYAAMAWLLGQVSGRDGAEASLTARGP